MWEPTRAACSVCGGQEIESDEVLDAGVLRLVQCLRCQHRWTERTLLPARTPERRQAEVASAA